MNEHAGASCALSVLIVGVFAVLLHQKDPPPTRTEPPTRPNPHAVADPPRRPESPGSPARRETSLHASGPPASIRPEPLAPAIEPAPPRPSIARAGPTASTIARKVAHPSNPARPQGGFTIVRGGESLADVAARVYGSGEAAETLWKANRDQLAAVDAPLPRGTLLRTP